MKQLLLLLTLCFVATACNDFRHAQYRQLKKVPAAGIVSIAEKPLQNTPADVSATLPGNDSTATEKITVNASMLISSPEKSAPARIVPASKPALEKTKLFPAKKILVAVPKRQPPDEGMATVFSLIIFIFGALMLISSPILIITGFVFGPLWLVAIGVLYFCIGFPPVWGMVKNIFTYRPKHDKCESSR